MKARVPIIVSAILALVLFAPALQAQGAAGMVHLYADSGCIAMIANLDQQLVEADADGPRHQVVASSLDQHNYTPRSHRKRGKKLSIQKYQLPHIRCYSPGRYLISFTSVVRQHAHGPNLSRAPPSFASSQA